MAIDGVAPRAKMNQQRLGRFQVAANNEIIEAEEERLRKQFEMEGKQVLPKQESEVSDSNIITPGTEFMSELSKALQSYISLRITCNSLWKNIMVILSDANVPGEGEHKIMSYIRKQRSLEAYDPNTGHCVYGSDADLIMLAMATHDPHISILREIKLATPGYRERYYKAKFSVEGSTDIECKRKEIVQKYTEGLVWVLQYYFSGVPSWTWFYPFHYGPFASDFKGMGQVRIKFEKGAPFLPLDQLLSVLPPASAHALPKAYAQLMLDENSRIIDFYPSDFEVDTEEKHFMWQGICKVPWIDDRQLVAETRELKNELSENEAIRNSVKLDSLCVRSTSKLAEKIGSLSLVSKLETRISSDGIGGIISLCHESVEKPCSDICDKKEDCALCVYLELPACSNHIPHLLSGVDLPEKTIFEGDIMETELWHERQRYYSRFDRVQSQDNWSEKMNNTSRFPSNASNQHSRSFSSNNPPSIYKGAGVGFSSGRGKRIDSMPNERMPLFLPSGKQHSHGGSYHATTNRDTRSQHFVDNFRQLRIPKSNNNHFPKPGGNLHFRPYNNGHMNQTETAPYHQGSQYHSGYMNRSKNGPNHQGSQYETVPFGRGQDRDASSSSISLRPQWSAGKSHQVKDQNRR